MKKVALIMGSDSDMPVVEKCIKVLEDYQIPYETHIYSAHRTPLEAAIFADKAMAEGFGVIVAFAGMAAHLAGALAAKTILPVIGVPCASGGLGGLDALLSTVQMPGGVPVATVAIGGGANAGHLAAQILALSDEELQARLLHEKERMHDGVIEKDHHLNDRRG